MMPEFEFEWFHYEVIDNLEKLYNGEIHKLMIFLHPRIGKTTIVSRFFPLWVLGKTSSDKIISAAHTLDLAKKSGRWARNATKQQKFLNIFPDFKIANDSGEASNWETNEDGYYMSAGVGGSIVGAGFNWGIIDDPFRSRADVESDTIRNLVDDWYSADFMSRRDPKRWGIVLMHQRWHMDDLAARLIEREAKDWVILSYPAISDDGKYLSERFGEEFYEETKRNTPVRDWASMYQQDPLTSSGAVFKPEDFRYFALSDLKKENFTFAVHIDPAFSTKKTSDGTAVIVTARHKETGEIYVLDTFSEQVTPSDSYAYIISLTEKWKSAGWFMEYLSVEDVSISPTQREFVRGLENELRRQRLFYTIFHFKPVGQGKKEDRIKFALEPMFNRHAIHFRNDEQENTTWKKLQEQLLKFPASRHDDLSDVLGQGCFMWNERGGGLEGAAEASKMYLQKVKSVKKK